LDKLLFESDEKQKISIEKKMELIQGIARGVLHLHKHNIIHRDLAARNILLSGSGEPKITVIHFNPNKQTNKLMRKFTNQINKISKRNKRKNNNNDFLFFKYTI
jgi:serine/threonine protein kinase